MTPPLFIVQLLGALALVAFAAGIVARFALADGTLWDRLTAAFKGSLTLFAAWLGMLLDGLPLIANVLADAIEDPAIRAQIDAVLPPAWRDPVSFFLTVGIWWARHRSLGR